MTSKQLSFFSGLIKPSQRMGSGIRLESDWNTPDTSSLGWKGSPGRSAAGDTLATKAIGVIPPVIFTPFLDEFQPNIIS
jgi:hypothetical protein